MIETRVDRAVAMHTALPTPSTQALLEGGIEAVDEGKLAEAGSATEIPWRLLAGGIF